MPACGDGVLQKGEQCDDGNVINRDGCNADCSVEPYCTCQGEPSACLCNRPITSNVPDKAGVRGKVTLGGFVSKKDFILGQASFQESVARALEIENLGGKDVVVLKVCHGSDCTKFWNIDRRRNLHASQMETVRDETVRIRAESTVVDFFVNRAESSSFTTTDVFKALLRPTFASKFIEILTAMTGRKVTASFENIQIVEFGARFSRPGYGPDGNSALNQSASAIFSLADKGATGLSTAIIIPIMTLFGIMFLYVLVQYGLKPFIRKMQEGRLHRMTRQQDAINQHKIAPDVVKVMNELEKSSDWKAAKAQASKQTSAVIEDDVIEYDFDVQEPPLGSETDQESEDIENRGELYDPGETHARELLSTKQPHDRQASVAGSRVSRAGSRMGNARSRLSTLEAQLDALLLQLPTDFLPTPPDSAGLTESSENYSEQLPDDVMEMDSEKVSVSIASGEDASASTPRLGAGYKTLGRPSGVLKIKVPISREPREKSKYKRPSLPQALPTHGLEDTTSIAGVVKPPTPSGPRTRPAIGSVRRAPNLSSIFDDSSKSAPAHAQGDSPTLLGQLGGTEDRELTILQPNEGTEDAL